MLDYDVEQQRTAAIAAMREKQNRLKLFITTGRFHYPSTPLSAPEKPSFIKLFNKDCERVANGSIRLEEYSAYLAANPQSALAVAVVWMKLERLVERLMAGADPRVILYEVMTDNLFNGV